MSNKAQDLWLEKAVGRPIDPDRAFGLQCVDVADEYAEACFPGVSWQTSLGGVGGARDLRRVNNKYFRWVPNVVGDLKSVPVKGDLAIFDGSAINPYGHVAIVLAANASTMRVLQQDGYLQVPAHVADLPYDGPGTGPCLGWLRPLTKADPPSRREKTLTVGPDGVKERIGSNVKTKVVRIFKPGDKITMKGWKTSTDPYGDGNNVWFICGYTGNTVFHSSGFVGGKTNTAGLPRLQG